MFPSLLFFSAAIQLHPKIQCRSTIRGLLWSFCQGGSKWKSCRSSVRQIFGSQTHGGSGMAGFRLPFSNLEESSIDGSQHQAYWHGAGETSKAEVSKCQSPTGDSGRVWEGGGVGVLRQVIGSCWTNSLKHPQIKIEGPESGRHLAILLFYEDPIGDFWGKVSNEFQLSFSAFLIKKTTRIWKIRRKSWTRTIKKIKKRHNRRRIAWKL